MPFKPDTDPYTRLAAAGEVIRPMTDFQRELFIGDVYIKLIEKCRNAESHTLSVEEQFHWRNIAHWLVGWGGGNRDPHLLLYDAYKTIKPHISNNQAVIDPVMLTTFFNSISSVGKAAGGKTGEVVEGAITMMGDGMEYLKEGTRNIVGGGAEIISNKIGEGIQVVGEKIQQTLTSVFGTMQDLAYVGIAAGMVGTTVIYLRQSRKDD